MARIELDQVTKNFSPVSGGTVPAVCQFSLTVEDKEFLVLVGPSGCGKTTILRLIAGLETPTSGRIHLEGQVVNHVPPRDRDIAMVFQKGALYPHLTVAENLAFGLKVRHRPEREIQQRIQETAELLGLHSCLDRWPRELSGGQAQRVALGRAIARRPRIFLLDEPLSSLDPPLRRQLRQEILALQHQLGTTLIYVTHDQEEALALGCRVAVMSQGRLQQTDDSQVIYDQPANLFVAGFIGSPPMNLLPGSIRQLPVATCFCEQPDSGAIGHSPAILPLAPDQAARLSGHLDQPMILGVRPEDLQVLNGHEVGVRPPDFEVGLESVENNGHETLCRLSTGIHPLVARLRHRLDPPWPSSVGIRINRDRLHFFDPVSGQAIGR